MSHDLLAAFGEPPQTSLAPSQDRFQQVEPPAKVINSPWEKTQPTRVEEGQDDDDDDDFGDFEDASATEPAVRESKPELPVSKTANYSYPPPKSPAQFPPKAQKKAEPVVRPKDSTVGKHPFADHMDFLFSGGDDEYDAGADELNDLATNPEAAMAYSKRIIEEQMERDSGRSNSGTNLPFSPKPKHPGVVLEGETPKPSTSARVPNKLPQRSGYPPAKDSSVLFDVDNISEEEKDDEDDDFGDFTEAVQRPSAEAASSKPVMPRIDLLGLNEPFSDDAGLDGLTSPRQRRAASVLGLPKDSRPSNLTTATSVHAEEETDAWDDFETPEPTFPAPSTAEPVSIGVQPPRKKPSELPLVPPTTIPPPSVLLSLSQKIFSQLAATSQPSSIAHIHALTHILAGRKSRWKRDNILASSMRIGSAAGKGMKLTGVDRAEMVREDREVSECVRCWKAVVGKVRGKGLQVPKMTETMVVKVLGVNEGGLKGNRACALCGLRREERVQGVDVGVEDCFGEWWVDGMEMHVFCKDFWIEFSEELKSR